MKTTFLFFFFCTDISCLSIPEPPSSRGYICHRPKGYAGFQILILDGNLSLKPYVGIISLKISRSLFFNDLSLFFIFLASMDIQVSIFTLNFTQYPTKISPLSPPQTPLFTSWRWIIYKSHWWVLWMLPWKCSTNFLGNVQTSEWW